MALRVYDNLLTHLFDDLKDLFFPRLCAGCQELLFPKETFLCALCRYRLPLTGYWKQKDNPVEKVFWGRVNLVRAHSYLFFRKGSITQSLLHQIKYKDNEKAAIGMGELYGRDYLLLKNVEKPDLILPVPLHKSKLKLRGFNQSERIARGFSATSAIPISLNSLLRVNNTVTQTKKERWDRVENMKGVFSISNENELKGKHVLLFDDVITTGATAEACILTLSQVPDIKISFAALACA